MCLTVQLTRHPSSLGGIAVWGDVSLYSILRDLPPLHRILPAVNPFPPSCPPDRCATNEGHAYVPTHPPLPPPLQRRGRDADPFPHLHVCIVCCVYVLSYAFFVYLCPLEVLEDD
eukprot:GGOE01025252.1.p3 GENE.GGOE01025252.1~~GGOE01025252.1.p3  ORF type:complete len:115 (-),score=4.56 GGOE01025252.1:72-416(-)